MDVGFMDGNGGLELGKRIERVITESTSYSIEGAMELRNWESCGWFASEGLTPSGSEEEEK